MPKNYQNNLCKDVLTTVQCTPPLQKKKPHQIAFFLFPKQVPNDTKIMIKVKGQKSLKKTTKSTLEMLHLIRQLGYSIYKDIKVLLFSYITKKHTYTLLKLRSSSTSNHYCKVLTSSQTLDNPILT